MGTITEVNCPVCHKVVPWTEEQVFRPFCSRRCQLVDFGEWASERHRIPAEDVHGQEDEDIRSTD
jgi:uncharacterized protein